jgi:pyruvate/2-oxoglutarate dehydrogenase complex dihydrolipoamide dehydrogenase (E3) component
MKEYDLISIGTSSAMHVVDAMLQTNPNLRMAVINKDEPRGICLTRGCIPSNFKHRIHKDVAYTGEDVEILILVLVNMQKLICKGGDV